MKKFRIATIVALASVICSLPATIWAGGYATARFGGDHGHAASEHVSSIYYNPAALAFGSGTRVYVEGLFVYRQATYVRRANAIDNFGSGTPDNDAAALDANSGEGELNNVLVSPFLGVVSDLGVDGLALGAALYVPFGGQAGWESDENFENNTMYPGAFDGVQRWSSIEGFHRVVYATAAGAYRLPGNVSVGVGVNLVSQSLSTVRARNLDGTDDLLASDGSIKEGRTLLEGTQTSVSIGAGLAWQPMDKLRIGVSYQSMPGFGESELEGSLTSVFGTSPEAGEVDTTLHLIVPDLFRWGISYKPTPKVEVRLAGDYTRWGKFEQHCLVGADSDGNFGECLLEENGAPADGAGIILLAVPRDWKDTFGARVGGSYWLKPSLELFGGSGYDSNAIPDSTLEPGFYDMGKVITTVGARYDMMGGKLKLTGAFTNVLYFKRETQPRNTDPERPSRNPDGAGVYEQLINFLSFGAQFAF